MEFIVGIIVGAILHYAFGKRYSVSGSFIIDLREEANEPIQLKMEESLNTIYFKKQVTFRVRVMEDDSQK